MSNALKDIIFGYSVSICHGDWRDAYYKALTPNIGLDLSVLQNIEIKQ